MGIFSNIFGSSETNKQLVRIEPSAHQLDILVQNNPGLMQMSDPRTVRRKSYGFGSMNSAFGATAMIPSPTGSPVTAYNSLQVATAWACINGQADDLAKLQIHVREYQKGGGSVINNTHRVAKLLRKPNYYQTPMEFIGHLAFSLRMRGNSYAYLYKNERGYVEQMFPLTPERCQLQVNQKDGSLWYWIHYPSFLNLTLYEPAINVLHVKANSLDGGLFGISPIAVGQATLGIAIATQDYAGKLFKQGTMARGYMSPTEGDLSQETATSIKTMVEEALSGSQNEHRIGVFEKGLNFTSLQMNAEEAQFIQSRAFNVEEVARFYRHPLHKLSVGKTPMGANLEALEQAYINDTLLPTARRIEEALESRLFTDNERNRYEIRFDFDTILRADTATRWAAHQVAVLNGLKNRDEIRAQEGMAPIPDGLGKTFSMPLNTGALNSDSVSGMAMTDPNGAKPDKQMLQDQYQSDDDDDKDEDEE
jgi:HK97 family phage portal protein